MKTIAIIGAGYSGLSLAMNIARLTTTPLNIILFDQSNQFGEGPAYRTRCLSHLLNVPAGKMSAFPDLPDDFVTWCEEQPDLPAFVREGVSVNDEFMPRAWYSRYLKHRFDVAQHQSLVQFECIGEAVTAVHPQQQGWQLNSADGSSWQANDVVLAIGNSEPHQSGPLAGCDHKNIIKNPWIYDDINQIKPSDRVLIVGTGLTMVDCVISLLKNQHQGAITALSRHGWLPQPHSPEPLPAATPRLLEARRISPLMHSLREWLSTSGLPWRAAIDSLRPQTQSLWQALPMIEKQRFTRHTQSAWEIHRHRIAPQIAAQLQAAIASKQLQIIAGRIQTISADSPFQCQYRKRHETTLLTMESDVIINCTGPNANLEKTKTPLIRQLITDKLATPDPLRLGFAVSPEDQLTTDYPGLYTLGPPTKGAYWEITAVPDIRVQSYNLAKRLLSEQG